MHKHIILAAFLFVFSGQILLSGPLIPVGHDPSTGTYYFVDEQANLYIQKPVALTSIIRGVYDPPLRVGFLPEMRGREILFGFYEGSLVLLNSWTSRARRFPLDQLRERNAPALALGYDFEIGKDGYPVCLGTIREQRVVLVGHGQKEERTYSIHPIQGDGKIGGSISGKEFSFRPAEHESLLSVDDTVITSVIDGVLHRRRYDERFVAEPTPLFAQRITVPDKIPQTRSRFLFASRS